MFRKNANQILAPRSTGDGSLCTQAIAHSTVAQGTVLCARKQEGGDFPALFVPLTYDDEGNLISVVDLQKQTTSYDYDQNSNLTQVIQDNKAKMTYTYDDYHNVTTATTEEGLEY